MWVVKNHRIWKKGDPNLTREADGPVLGIYSKFWIAYLMAMLWHFRFPLGWMQVHSYVRGKVCPINERTADGDLVGQCFRYCPDGKTCPHHGDVSEAIQHYEETGHLTPEPHVV